MSSGLLALKKNKLLIGALSVLIACVVSGAAFAAWVNNGPQILLSMSASALAWCF